MVLGFLAVEAEAYAVEGGAVAREDGERGGAEGDAFVGGAEEDVVVYLGF